MGVQDRENIRTLLIDPHMHLRLDARNAAAFYDITLRVQINHIRRGDFLIRHAGRRDADLARFRPDADVSPCFHGKITFQHSLSCRDHSCCHCFSFMIIHLRHIIYLIPYFNATLRLFGTPLGPRIAKIPYSFFSVSNVNSSAA